jgi:hypothetical protein
LIPVILHLFLSISFALISTKSDQQKLLLSTIIQLIENVSSRSINKNISDSAMITIMNLRTNRKFRFFLETNELFISWFLVMEKGMSDNGYFVRCLTSLIINSNSIKLTKQIINFYRNAFDDQEFEVNFFSFLLINQF